VTATVLYRFASSDECEEEEREEDIKTVEIEYSECDEPVEHMISLHKVKTFKMEVQICISIPFEFVSHSRACWQVYSRIACRLILLPRFSSTASTRTKTVSLAAVPH